MNLSDDDVKFFLETMAGNVLAYNALEAIPDHVPHVKYPRTRGHRPEPHENPYNAWYYKSEVNERPRVRSRASAWPSRTTSAWPACR